MKLRIFRIFCIAFLSILAIAGLGLAIYNMIVAEQRQEPSYLLYLICFFIGFLFSCFEVYFIIYSFKHGTLLLHSMCIKESNSTKRKATLILSSIGAAISLGFLIFNICIYTGVCDLKQTPMTVEFNMYFCTIALINLLILMVYWLFIVQDDIEISR